MTVRKISRDEMTPFTIGQRVRLTAEIAVFNLDAFGAGATGTVTDVSPDAAEGMPIAHVRMDDHFAGLDAWNNELQVFRASEQCADVTDDLFRTAE